MEANAPGSMLQPFCPLSTDRSSFAPADYAKLAKWQVDNRDGEKADTKASFGWTEKPQAGKLETQTPTTKVEKASRD